MFQSFDFDLQSFDLELEIEIEIEAPKIEIECLKIGTRCDGVRNLTNGSLWEIGTLYSEDRNLGRPVFQRSELGLQRSELCDRKIESRLDQDYEDRNSGPPRSELGRTSAQAEGGLSG